MTQRAAPLAKLPLWRLRACPRCHGDQYLESLESRRANYSCLQCGQRQELSPQALAGLKIFYDTSKN